MLEREGRRFVCPPVLVKSHVVFEGDRVVLWGKN